MAVTLATGLVQDGETMEWVNGGSAVAAGDIVVVGARIGRAAHDIAAGATGTLQMRGVISGPANANVSTQGMDVYWDTTPGEFTATATANVPGGQCWKTVAGGVAHVSLGPVSTPVP